jgi:acetyl-CoA carboxylase biotin carboxyl carrier protein
MNLREIRQLIKIVENSAIDELEIEEEGKKVRISKHNKHQNEMPHIQLSNQPAPLPPVTPLAEQTTIPESAATSPPAPESEKMEYQEIRAPMVGTFYRAPSPDADPYVDIGHQVTAGQTLCIIEAMKLMNEIESEYNGTIVKILAENAQPVEYNQPLFLIEK